MNKLQDIKTLINSLPIGALIEPELDETINLAEGKLTPLGQFVIRVEHIIDRDDKTIAELNQRLRGKYE